MRYLLKGGLGFIAWGQFGWSVRFCPSYDFQNRCQNALECCNDVLHIAASKFAGSKFSILPSKMSEMGASIPSSLDRWIYESL